MSDLQTTTITFYSDMRDIIINAQYNAVCSVDVQRVLMYWRLGERIVIEEQCGQERAGYGEYLIKNLAKGLEG
ncbi:MAG: DUF1016 N-terminal domain-containing protein [Euryarchaeota archaeon]|nr:DUF1016 N-terminal domain-containing protein [Euryarchaeota archaeon]